METNFYLKRKKSVGQCFHFTLITFTIGIFKKRNKLIFNFIVVIC